MKITITVTAEGRFWSGGAAIVVPEPMVEAFEPFALFDDLLMSMATGETLFGSAEQKKKIEMRKDVAEYLSKALADYLVLKMKKHDTYNGYKEDTLMEE